MSDVNIFSSLFSWRPRKTLTPEENFLTESLIYVCKRSPEARAAWLRTVLGVHVQPETIVIDTRASHEDTATRNWIYPDVEVKGRLSDNTEFRALFEHKWRSICELDQLRRYENLLDPKVPNQFLAFICGSNTARAKAEKFVAKAGITFPKPILWEDVYSALAGVPVQIDSLVEFLSFMKEQGLGSVDPIRLDEITSFIAGRGLPDKLENYVRKVRTCAEGEWKDLIPQRYSWENVDGKYGRWAFRLNANWRPALIIGIMYDNKDYKVPFVAPDSLDIIFRISATGQNLTDMPGFFDALSAKRAQLESQCNGVVVRLFGDKENQNADTILLIQRSLVPMLAGQASDRHISILCDEFKKWIEIIFGDNSLEPFLATLGNQIVTSAINPEANLEDAHVAIQPVEL